MGRLFGTDGIRAVANGPLLNCKLAMDVGQAAALVVQERVVHRPAFIIGQDTRLSSDMLANALAAGLCSAGADVRMIGVVPTPAVAYLVKAYGADSGIMLSASHNSYEYNGIKIFDGNGYKLSDSAEEEIEAILLDGAKELPQMTDGGIGRIIYDSHAVEDYVEHIVGTVDVPCKGLRIVVDCANGSASATARKIFGRLGAECVYLHCEPDGVNINRHCGSTHIAFLSEYVKTHSFDLGVAFDGDADRCLAVDAAGNLVDGDRLIALFADHMRQNGVLRGAVVTVLSNMGFFKFTREHGIQTEVTKVGDRYVLEKMLENGYNIGGEQSGHVIFTDYMTTGDGQLSAAQLLAVMQKSGRSLEELSQMMTVFPQTMVNIHADADAKARYAQDEEIAAYLKQKEAQLSDAGRILVRPSGTEPLIRVMLEGEDEELIHALAREISDYITAKIS